MNAYFEGDTLETILKLFREEIGVSTNPRHNLQARSAQVSFLRRAQQTIYDRAKWPHMRATVTVPIEAGISRYAIPDGVRIAKIDRASLVRDGYHRILVGSIGTAERNLHIGSYPDYDDRDDLTRSFKIHADGSIEIWPIPRTSGGVIEIEGYRELGRFVEDNDRADMDTRLILLFASAERLMSMGDGSADYKRQLAESLLLELSRESSVIKSFVIGGGYGHEESGDSYRYSRTRTKTVF